MLKRRVHLHGRFKAYAPGPIEVFAATIWDAVEAVTTQIKGFAPCPTTGRQVIQVKDFTDVRVMRSPDNKTEDIHIFPAMVFGKDQGLLQTVIGVTLMVVGALVIGMGNPFGAALFGAGLGMTIGGVMQMLSPVPQLNAGNEDQVRSRYLPSNQNTVAIGTPLGILYGLRRIGGHILSINVDAKDTGI